MAGRKHCFITIDAETPVLLEGARALHLLRQSLEQQSGRAIPLTWFVRFQRSWTDTVKRDDDDFFSSPLHNEFDGFGMIEPLLDELLQAGDEIGWHYHAYRYVLREDLPHEVRLRDIEADLVTCARTIESRYGGQHLRAFRWGWMFTPDFALHSTLRDLGYDIDASIRPNDAGKKVSAFDTRHLTPVTTQAACLEGVHYFPFIDTLLTHDYSVVAHDLGWSTLDDEGARQSCNALRAEMLRLINRAEEIGASLTTYQAAAGS